MQGGSSGGSMIGLTDLTSGRAVNGLSGFGAGTIWSDIITRFDGGTIYRSHQRVSC